MDAQEFKCIYIYIWKPHQYNNFVLYISCTSPAFFIYCQNEHTTARIYMVLFAHYSVYIVPSLISVVVVQYYICIYSISKWKVSEKYLCTTYI